MQPRWSPSARKAGCWRPGGSGRPRAWTLACGVLVGALALGGCLPDPPSWQGPESGRTVGVVGDSLTFRAEKGPNPLAPGNTNRFTTDALIQGGHRASVSAMGGATTIDLDSLADWAAPGADIVVVALGTNDMYVVPETGQSAVSVAAAVGHLDAYLDRVAAECVVLVNVVEDTPSWGLAQTAPPWNAILAQEAIDRDGVLVDWAAAVRDSPVPLLGPDGVHHSPEGMAAYRQAALDGVAQCAARLDAA